MLLRFGFLIVVNNRDKMLLPRDRAGRALIRNLVEHIVERIHRIHDLPHKVFLSVNHRRIRQRMGFGSLAIAVAISIHAVDVIAVMKWMERPRVLGSLRSFPFDTPPLEQHHRDIHTVPSGLLHPRRHSLEEERIDAIHIKLRPSVQGNTWSRPQVRHGFKQRILLTPEPEKVQMISRQES